MTYSSQPTTSTSQGYPGYRQHGKDMTFTKVVLAVLNSSTALKVSGQGQSSPGAWSVTAGLPEKNRVNQLIASSCSTPP
jgi:hypothetical protein